MTTADERRRRRAIVEGLARDHGGVVSRAMLRAVGAGRGVVRNEVASGRWVLHGDQTVALGPEALSAEGERWRAYWEVGERIAVIDGASALVAAGLTGFTVRSTQVSVPHGSDPGVISGIELHRVTTRPAQDVLPTGPPRTTSAVAAIRAAQWAASDRQAALVLAMTVQQRLATGGQLVEAALRTPGRRRVAFILRIARDIALGAESLGELDFAVLCRRRGLPEPTRQRLVHGPRGRIYLDVSWDDVGLVVEIDGAGHREGLAVASDNLRHNALTLSGRTVLRIDLVGLRLDPDAFLDQVCEAHARLSRRLVIRASG